MVAGELCHGSTSDSTAVFLLPIGFYTIPQYKLIKSGLDIFPFRGSRSCRHGTTLQCRRIQWGYLSGLSCISILVLMEYVSKYIP